MLGRSLEQIRRGRWTAPSAAAALYKTNLTIRIDTWLLSKIPGDKTPFDLDRRFSLTHLEKISEGKKVLELSEYEKVESPTADQMLEQIFSHMARTWERAGDGNST